MKTRKGVSHNTVADKLCSAIEKGGCDNVLQSEYSRIFATYSLSEAGIAFFGVNAVALTARATAALAVLPYIYLAVLPMSLWSVWYQAHKVRSWCTLCLATMLLLWLQTVLFVCAGAFVPITDLSLCSVVAISLLYATAVIIVHSMTKCSDQAHDNMRLRYSLNRIRQDKGIFLGLLHRQPHFGISPADRGLEFGEAREGVPAITVLSNPYCTHCSEMHRRLDAAVAAGMQVRYILTRFNDELAAANKSIIATYVRHGSEYTWDMLSRWYAGGMKEGARFFNGILHKEDTCRQEVGEIFASHESWVESSGLSATPILMFDGYLLPEHYRIEDIIEMYRKNRP